MNVSLTERCYDLLAPRGAGRLRPAVRRVGAAGARPSSSASATSRCASCKLAPDHDALASNSPTFDIVLTMADEVVERFRWRAGVGALDLDLATELATPSRSMDVYYERLMAELLRLDGPDAVLASRSRRSPPGARSSASTTTRPSSAPASATCSPAIPTTSPPRCVDGRSPCEQVRGLMFGVVIRCRGAAIAAGVAAARAHRALLLRWRARRGVVRARERSSLRLEDSPSATQPAPSTRTCAARARRRQRGAGPRRGRRRGRTARAGAREPSHRAS